MLRARLHRMGRDRERGSFALELAVVAPALLLVIAFLISVGRVTEGRAMVQGAARDAARAATINHNGSAAARAAAMSAFAAATQGMNCDPLTLTPGVIAPDVRVQATARCFVTTMWGRQEVERTAFSVVDRYRGTD
jgi:Flp pilus assembly protein TadG